MNILVVDDDVALCRVLSRFLEKHGQRVFSAIDALQAEDILERESIQLVITDIEMPHRDGIALTAKLKQDPRFSRIPIVLLSNQGTEQVADEGLRLGAALILHKPVDFQRLLNVVRSAE